MSSPNSWLQIKRAASQNCETVSWANFHFPSSFQDFQHSSLIKYCVLSIFLLTILFETLSPSWLFARHFLLPLLFARHFLLPQVLSPPLYTIFKTPTPPPVCKTSSFPILIGRYKPQMYIFSFRELKGLRITQNCEILNSRDSNTQISWTTLNIHHPIPFRQLCRLTGQISCPVRSGQTNYTPSSPPGQHTPQQHHGQHEMEPGKQTHSLTDGQVNHNQTQKATDTHSLINMAVNLSITP